MNRYSRVHAEIDLDAILHNMDAMRGNIAKDTKIMAVIKADGYGHGAVEIAETIEKLDYLYGYAVATVEEGLILRNHGIQKPILILGYPWDWHVPQPGWNRTDGAGSLGTLRPPFPVPLTNTRWQLRRTKAVF